MKLAQLKRMARQQLRVWLQTEAVVLLDGAMGTELVRRYRVAGVRKFATTFGGTQKGSTPDFRYARGTENIAFRPDTRTGCPETPNHGREEAAWRTGEVVRLRSKSFARFGVSWTGNLGELLAALNLCQPEWVRRIHRAYLKSGAQCLLTNTFLAWPRQADSVGTRYFRQLNRLGVQLARETAAAMGRVAPILASVGPWPDGPDSVRNCLAQLRALRDADAILLETQSSLAFLESVVAGLHLSWPRPILVSFSFCRRRGRYLTWPDQHTPEEVADWADQHRRAVFLLGVNCGCDLDLEDITRIVRLYRKRTTLPILVRPNAGSPQWRAGRPVYPLAPSDFANAVPDWLAAGASWIGGCCGTTPRHIAAMRQVLPS